MESSDPLVDRVVLPLYTRGDESHLVLTATVLASWFRAPLQLVAPDADAASACESLATTLGVATDPVVCIDSPSFIDGTIDHLQGEGSVLCVTAANRGGLDVARRSGQLVFLVGGAPRARVATGPLAVELPPGDEPNDVLATVAIWASALECGVRLVVGAQGRDERSERAEQRLVELGIDVGIDDLRSPHEPPLVLSGRTRDATAIALSSATPNAPDLLTRADEAGVAVLVVPDARARAAAGPQAGAADPGGPQGDERPAPASESFGRNVDVLDYDECLDYLGTQSIGRVAYVEGGWPTAVPVNYAVHGGVVFIRSQEGGKLEAARRNDVVCIEVDETDEATRTGWSVVGHGALKVVADPGSLQLAWENDPSPWIDGDRWHWLQLTPFSLSGRRIGQPSADPSADPIVDAEAESG